MNRNVIPLWAHKKRGGGCKEREKMFLCKMIAAFFKSTSYGIRE
jgi:hypothetical protein